MLHFLSFYVIIIKTWRQFPGKISNIATPRNFMTDEMSKQSPVHIVKTNLSLVISGKAKLAKKKGNQLLSFGAFVV